MKKTILYVAAIIVSLIFINFAGYTAYAQLSDRGWLVTENEVTKLLQSGNKGSVSLLPVEAMMPLYKRLGLTYVGEDKTKINTNYPMVVGDSTAVKFFNDTSSLITKDFGALPTYEGLYLSAGATFNTDRQRADEDEFILASLQSGMHILAQRTQIDTVYSSHVLPMNTIVNFTKDKVIYMEFKDGKYVSGSIEAMNGATITIGSNKYDYYDFLLKLGKLQKLIDKDKNKEVDPIAEELPAEEEKEEIISVVPVNEGDNKGDKDKQNSSRPSSNTSIPQTSEDEQESSSSTGPKEEDDDSSKDSSKDDSSSSSSSTATSSSSSEIDTSSSQTSSSGGSAGGSGGSAGGGGGSAGGGTGSGTPPNRYKIPTVTLGKEIVPWVYNVKFTLDIVDPDSRLYRGAYVYIYNEDTNTLLMRKTIRKSGETTLGILPPDANLSISVSFKYYDDKDEKIDVIVTKEPVLFKTLSRDKLVPITIGMKDMSEADVAKSIQLYPYKISVDDVAFLEAVEHAQNPDNPKKPEITKPVKNADVFSDKRVELGSLYEEDMLFSRTLNDTGEGTEGKVGKVGKVGDGDGGEEEPSEYTALDTIAYIKKAVFTVSDGKSEEKFSIPASQLKQLREGHLINFITTEVLKSNLKYSYKLDIYDNYDEKMPITDKSLFTGNTRTCKAIPSATVRLTGNEVGKLSLKIDVGNVDNAEITNPVIRILKDGVPVLFTGKLNGKDQSGKAWAIDKGKASYEVLLTDLLAGETYTAEVFCDEYMIEDNVEHKNQTLGQSSFYTSSINTIGYAHYQTKFSQITSDSAVTDIRLLNRTNEMISKLMKEVSITLKDTKGNSVVKTVITKDKLNGITNIPVYNSQTSLWELVIEVTDTYQLALTASTKDELENPWEAFLNSRSSETTSPTLQLIAKTGSLQSVTEYELDIATFIDQGGKMYDVSNRNPNPTFKTLKKAPVAEIENQFTTSNFHEIYNYSVKDPDKAIVDGNITVRLYRGVILAQTITMKANTVYGNYRFNNLLDLTEYEIQFIADLYNVGYENTTLRTSQKIASFHFKTGEGVSGAIDLLGVDQRFEDDEISVSEANLAEGARTRGDITKGEYYSSAGKLTASPNIISMKIPVVSDKTYAVLNGSGGIVAYFDANDKFISGIGAYNVSGNALNGLLKVPSNENISYAWITNTIERIPSISVMKFDENVESPNLVNKETITKGSYLSTAGTLIVDERYALTDYISVRGGCFYEYDNRGTNSMSMVFYNRNQGFIQGVSVYNKGIVQAPRGATSVRITINIDYVDNFKFRINKKLDANAYNARFKVSLTDKKNDLIHKPQYTLKMYRADLEHKEDPEKYRQYGEKLTFDIEVKDGITQPVLAENVYRALPVGYAWRVELSVNAYGSDIVLDSERFDTVSHVRTISNQDDLLAIRNDSSANYIVIADFEINTNMFDSQTTIQGEIDFQGHTITNTMPKPFIHRIGDTGKIKNIVVNHTVNHTVVTSVTDIGALAYSNMGLIDNAVINVDVQAPNRASVGRSGGGIVVRNEATGVIRNFAVNVKSEMKINMQYGGVAYYNVGKIEDGWISGEAIHAVAYGPQDIDGSYPVQDNDAQYVGGVVGLANKSSSIKRVYSLVDIIVDKGKTANRNLTGTLVGDLLGSVENCYTTGTMWEFDPNEPKELQKTVVTSTYNGIGRFQGGYRVTNSFYFSPYTYDKVSTTLKQANYAMLWDVLWQNNVIGTGKQFLVNELVNTGYYPQVKMNSCMNGQQSTIKLPDVTMKDQDIISTIVTHQGLKEATAVITILNDQNYKIVGFDIEGLDCEITNQSIDDKLYRVFVTLKNPTKFISSYKINSMTAKNSLGATNTTYYNSTQAFGLKYIDAEFYDEIYNASDWERLRLEPSQNYRLVGDIDFSMYTDFNRNIRVGTVFSGKLDGGIYDENENLVGMHTIKNITNSDVTYGNVFDIVAGTIKNIVVDKYVMTAGAQRSHGGFINNLKQKATLKNVHIKNSEIYAKDRAGALVSTSEAGSIIENCSASDSVVASEKKIGTASTFYGGGLVGYGTFVTIDGCYAQNITVRADEARDIAGVGGLIGYSDKIEMANCWATGTVSANGSYAGGITGFVLTGVIQSCWTDVDVTTVGEFAGGIAGEVRDSTIKNSFVLGGVYTRSNNTSFVHRIASNDTLTASTNNYAYEHQLMNGAVSKEKDGAYELSTYEQLTSAEYWTDQMRMSSSFDYKGEASRSTDEEEVTSVKEGYLPMIIGTDGTLVYGQKPHALPEMGISIVVNQTELNPNNNTFVANATVNHGDYVIVPNGVKMDGAKELTITQGATVDGATTVNIKGTLVNAWDSYMMTVQVGNDVKSLALQAQIEFSSPVYQKITNNDDWNTYLENKSDSYENIRIEGNIDFTGHSSRPNVLNVKLNRLVGTNPDTLFTFGNLNYTAKENAESVIAEVVSEVAYINLKNITFTNDKFSSASSGVIGKNLAEIHNTEFNDIDLALKTGSYKGCIGKSYGYIHDVKLKGIKVVSDTGGAVGGFIGHTISGTVERVEMVGEKDKGNYTNNIISGMGTPASDGSYVGAISGYTEGGSTMKNVSVSGSSVIGKGYVGGISGVTITNMSNLNVDNCYIEATRLKHATNDTYYGGSWAGGISGYVVNYTVSDSVVTNTKIIARQEGAGGINGSNNYAYSTMLRNTVDNCEIIAEYAYAGGINANAGNVSECVVKNSTITAENSRPAAGTQDQYDGGKAGGITGGKHTTIRDSRVENCVIKAGCKDRVGSYAGGLMGRGIELNDTGYFIHGNTVTGCTVEAENNVGGLVGYSSTRVYNNFVQDTTVRGVNNIGGLVGHSESMLMYNNAVGEKVTVTATGVNAGGMIGYGAYYTTRNQTRFTRVYNSYSSATVTAEDCAGGLVGQFDPGADISNWPKNSLGEYYGTPTTMFPSNDYFGLLFMGDVTTTGKSVVAGYGERGSLFGNKSSQADIGGLGASRIYQGATLKIQDKPVKTANDVYSGTLAQHSINTASGLTLISANQMEQKQTYFGTVLEGGMAWTEKNGFDGNGIFPLNKYQTQFYMDTDGSMVVNTNTNVNGNHTINIETGKATTNSYVQDDLILWYDARNRGADSGKWKNLAPTGEAYDGTLYWNKKTQDAASDAEKAKMYWSNNGLNWTHNKEITNYVSVPNITGLLDNTSTYTVEFCYEQPEDKNGYGPLMSGETSSGQAFNYGKGANISLFYMGHNTSFAYNDTNERTITFTASGYDIGTGFATKRVYSNGGKDFIVARPGFSATFVDENLRIGTSQWHDFDKQTISSVRIYKRVLSAQEIMSNNEVDDALYVKGKNSVLATKEISDVEFKNGTATLTKDQLKGLYLEGMVSIGIDSSAVQGQTILPEVNAIKLDLIDSSGNNVVPGTRFDTTPTLTVSGGGSVYTWYRVDSPVYSGQEVAQTTEKTQALHGKGYYYCKDEQGNYSTLVLVDTPSYMPYVHRAALTDTVLVGQEGYDVNGNPYLSDDKWYSGGTPIRDTSIILRSLGRMTSMRSFDTLTQPVPKATLYASDIDTVNLELDSTIPWNAPDFVGESYFTVLQDGIPIMQNYIDKRVYSFKYDFKTPLTISITNGKEEQTYHLKPDDVRRTVMTYGDTYYYLTSDGISSSKANTNENVSGQFVNLFNGKALAVDGKIYNVTDNTLVDSMTQMQLHTTSTPLFTGKYGEQNVQSFSNFSVLSNNDEVILREMGIVINDDQVYTIPDSSVAVADGFVIDTYAEKEYFGILSEKGIFEDISTNIVIPEKVKLTSIAHMSNTYNSSAPYVLFRYNSGNVAGFNYITGEKLELIQPREINGGFLDFVQDYLGNQFGFAGGSLSGGYRFAKDLQGKLETDGMFTDALVDNGFADGKAQTDGDVGKDNNSNSSTKDGEGLTSGKDSMQGESQLDGDGLINGSGVVDGVGNMNGDGQMDGNGQVNGSGQTNGTGQVDGESQTDGEGQDSGENQQSGESNSQSSSENGSGEETAGDDKGQTNADDKNNTRGNNQDTDKDTAQDENHGKDSGEKNGESQTQTKAEQEQKSQAIRNQKYIRAYNPASGRYELYTAKALLSESQTELEKSETQKIEKLQSEGKVPQFNLGMAAKGQKTVDKGIYFYIIIVILIGLLVVGLAIKNRRNTKRK